MKKLLLILLLGCLVACGNKNQYQIKNQHETDLVTEWLRNNHSNVHYNEKKVFHPIGSIGEDNILYNDYNAVEYTFYLNDDEDDEATTSPDRKKHKTCSCIFLIEQDTVISLSEYWEMVLDTSNDYKSTYWKKEKKVK